MFSSFFQLLLRPLLWFNHRFISPNVYVFRCSAPLSLFAHFSLLFLQSVSIVVEPEVRNSFLTAFHSERALSRFLAVITRVLDSCSVSVHPKKINEQFGMGSSFLYCVSSALIAKPLSLQII
jgi:hypothetical protein